MTTKFEVLNLASEHGATLTTAEIIERAEAYWNFIGCEKQPEEAPTTSVEPGVRRGRKPKAVEVIHDEHGPATPLPEADALKPSIVKEDSKSEEVASVDYKEVQVAVVNLVRGSAEGKDKAVAILEQFGVATALDLKPEQYAEALELFRAAA